MSQLENTDPRYVRSRVKLRAAFLELAHEDPEKLTVSAICERTGIDRATFYRHFDSIDDLVADALADLADQANQQWEATSTGSGLQLPESTAIFVRYLKHVEENWRLYQWALSPKGSSKTLHALLDRSARGVAFELHKLDDTLSPDEVEFRASFASGGILGACIHWLSTEKPSCSAEELATRILDISDQRLKHVFA
ncbi:TetR/AcrR family transcriptional regulator [Leifsonia poae]|uniref:TetR/AcrR family transcriptional regulator n=1 Tax=Leifsonia poae TaxID=110933 RepID=UPI001CBEB2D4|nr:TetR/AcrR family transcriptional regulator [Leifsonia poae]